MTDRSPSHVAIELTGACQLKPSLKVLGHCAIQQCALGVAGVVEFWLGRSWQLCNAHGLPIVSLTDTPGFMVGPDIEAQAQVRHVCRMFVVAAHLSVPYFTVVLRKGYGLGAQAMAAGGFDAPVFTVAWPTGEFGAMGLEGAVKLGYRKELDAAAPGAEREAPYQSLVDQQYENGQAINMAATLEIDAVIDPAQTRSWLVRGLASAVQTTVPRSRFVDTW